MDIEKALKDPRLLHALTGMSLLEFETLLIIFEQVLFEERSKKDRHRKVGGGAKGCFNIKSARSKLFFILFYFKVYPTFDLAGFIFNSNKTNAHRWMHNTLPLLEKALDRKMVLPKRKMTTPEAFFRDFPEVQEVMIDGVERPIQRPSKDKTQRKHYSGKKKRHTRKNIVIADKTRRILYISPTKHGSVHDKKLADKNMITTNIPDEISVVVDTGFQGFDTLHPNSLQPKKKPRNGQLTTEEKEMNRLISSIRIVVEHAIGGMKKFKVASDLYRNKNGIDDIFMSLSAGLWNHHVQMR